MAYTPFTNAARRQVHDYMKRHCRTPDFVDLTQDELDHINLELRNFDRVLYWKDGHWIFMNIQVKIRDLHT